MNLQSETYLTNFRKKIFAIIVLLVLILVVYSNTFHASWHLDDEPNILHRKEIHLTKLNWPQIKKTFFKQLDDTERRLLRPAACLSLALNYYFGKENVFGYHLVNIFVHSFASIFLFLFIYHTLNLPLLKARYGPNSYSIALLATIFWAINPIQTQAVTYIVQRMASMAGMFYIISMYFYLKGRVTARHDSRTIFFISSALAGLMAIGSKENAIMLPVSVYIFDLFFIQGLSRETLNKNLKAGSLIILLIICLGIISFFLFQKDISFLKGYEHRVFTLKERLLSEPRIVLFYLTLIFYPDPTRLSLEHDVTISKTLLNPPTTLMSILLIMGILLGALYISRRRPFISFSVIFFFLNHLIESSIFSLELTFEHRNYIPSMFLFVPVAILLVTFVNYYSFKKPMQVLITIFIIGLIVGQGHGTFIRNSIWKTEESLWIDATEKAPDACRPWHNLARYYEEKNMHRKALSIYQKTLSKKETHNKGEKYLTHYNLGIIYQTIGEKDKALFHYLEAEKIDPSFANLHSNKGALLAEKGLIEDAVYEFKQAIRHDDHQPEAHCNLGIILLRMGRIDEAIQHLETSLRIKPHSAFTLKRLGYAYRKKGLYGKAYLLYKRALALEPLELSTLLYLSEIYSIKGMEVQKQKALKRFVRLTKEEDLRDLIAEITSKGGKSDRILIDKKVVLKLISEAYSREASNISKKRRYIEKKFQKLTGEN